MGFVYKKTNVISDQTKERKKKGNVPVPQKIVVIWC